MIDSHLQDAALPKNVYQFTDLRLAAAEAAGKGGGKVLPPKGTELAADNLPGRGMLWLPGE